MKRFALLGVILVGALGFGVYQMTRASDDPASTPTSTSATSTSSHGESSDGTAAKRLRSPGRSEVQAATHSGVPGTAGTVSPETVANPADATARSADQREGLDAIKPRPKRPAEPTTAENSPEAAEKKRMLSQQRMNHRFEAAACREPGMAKRLAAMTATEREKIRARCADAGVKI